MSISYFSQINASCHSYVMYDSCYLSKRQLETVKKVLCHTQYSLSAVKLRIAAVKSVQKCADLHLTSHFLHFLCRKEIVKFKS